MSKTLAPQAHQILGEAPAVLVCLNPQDEQIGHLTRASARSVARAIERMALCLQWARANQVTIFHVFTPQAASHAAKKRPTHAIASIRPRADEAVLQKTGLSVFDSPEFTSVSQYHGCANVLLIGFTLACDCLVSAIDAVRAKRRLILIEDAIASFDLPPYSAAESEGVILALLAQFSAIASSDDLPDLFNRQPERQINGHSRH